MRYKNKKRSNVIIIKTKNVIKENRIICVVKMNRKKWNKENTRKEEKNVRTIIGFSLTFGAIKTASWSSTFLWTVSQFAFGTATWQWCSTAVGNIWYWCRAAMTPIWTTRCNQTHFDWIEQTWRRWTEGKRYWTAFITSFRFKTRITFLDNDTQKTQKSIMTHPLLLANYNEAKQIKITKKGLYIYLIFSQNIFATLFFCIHDGFLSIFDLRKIVETQKWKIQIEKYAYQLPDRAYLLSFIIFLQTHLFDPTLSLFFLLLAIFLSC